MNTALAPVQKNDPQYDLAIRSALKTSLYPGAADASIDAVLLYCQAGGYDPMMKPVHIVPMSVSTGQKDGNGRDIKEMRDVIMPGVGLYRTNAARTKAYAGCSEPEFGPVKTLKVMRDVWTDGPNGRRINKPVPFEFEYPEWCRITVKRLVDGQIHEFTAKEYWIENYADKGQSGEPNSMWAKRPYGQLAKCTEAQALRKAFPEAAGSQPTAEEMEGRVIDGDFTTVPDDKKTGLQMPKEKTTAAAAKEATPATETASTSTPAAAAEPEAEVTKDAGIFLDASPKTMLLKKGLHAGFNEEELIAKYRRIDFTNLNTVLAELRTIAETRDNG